MNRSPEFRKVPLSPTSRDPKSIIRALSAPPRKRPGGFASTGEIASATRWNAEEADPVSSLAIAAAWRRAAGTAVAAVTRVAGFDRGVLTIEILDRAWERDLSRLKETILETLNAEASAPGARARRPVKALELRAAEGSARPDRGVPAPSRPAAGEEPCAEPAAADLHERLAQVAERYLRARGSSE